MRAGDPLGRSFIRACFVAAGLVAASFAACARARLAPEPADTVWAAARWPGTTSADLEAGYGIYRRRCAGCHHLPVPTAHSEEQWQRALGEMSLKAKLTDGERYLLVRYVFSVRERTAGTDGPR